MEYRILGPVQVIVGGRLLELGPRKQRALLALLLTQANRTIATDQILDALWGDDASGKENALWVYISRLRSILAEVSTDPILVTKDHGYSLEIEPSELDATVFERLTAEGIAALPSQPVEASALLREALELWRGNPLEEFTYDEWAQSEIGRLLALRRSSTDARLDADLMTGRAGELIAELEQEVVLRPYDETPIRQLMLALYRSGRQADALRTFERFRRQLGEETGTDPTPELRRLEEQVLFHDPRIARTIASPQGSASHSNPYRGLEAFREEDSHVFFGRDRLMADVLTMIRDHPIVVIIGPSGCGKSSVVRSGVVPALRKGALPGSDRWLIASMIPGTHPFVELEAALLRTQIDTPESLRSHLDGDPNEILRAALRVCPTDNSTVLVLVDQFEELFTVCAQDTMERFLTGLLEAAADSRRRVRFLLTLRADFYERTLIHPRFASAMASGIVNVAPMAPEELEEAAAGPARSSGVRLEPGLEAALIGDVLGAPGALPLFEFALTDLFDRRVGDTLTIDAYRAMGGIDGTVSRKADHIYDRLSASQQVAARQVFLRLVSIGSDETRSRRRVAASELIDTGLDITDIRAVLDSFGSERLLSFDRSGATGSPMVEVAHEALLERWERLAEWIRSAQDDVLRNARLAELASEWRDKDRNDAYLLSEGRYDEYAAWARTSTMTVARSERDYLDASRQALDDRKHAEQERGAREAKTARRARRNAWSLIAVAVAVAVVGSYLVWSALRPPPVIALVRSELDTGGIAVMIKAGFDQASQDFDTDAREVVTLANMEQKMADLAEQGTDLIIASIDLLGFVESVAADHPDTQFAVLDSVLASGPNIAGAEFDDQGLSYLAGVTAALTTETDVVGILLGVQNPFMEDFARGYEAGVASVDSDITVLLDFVSAAVVPNITSGLRPDGFERPDEAYAAAMHMYLGGADVIFSAAGSSGYGSIEAAANYSKEQGTHVWAIGVDYDEGFLSGSTVGQYVLTSMIKRYDEATYRMIEAYLDGTLESTMQFGFENGGLSYSKYGGHVDDIAPQLDDVIEALVGNEIVFPPTVTTPPAWHAEADDSIVVTFDGKTCRASRPPRVEPGQTLNVAAVNTTPRPVVIGIGYVPTGEMGDVISGFAWTVASGSNYDIRAVMVGNPRGGVVVGCFPDEATVFATEVFTVVEG